MRAAGEHGALDLEEAAVGERLRGVDDEEVRQQQLGQRVDALVVRRPVGPAVEPVEEGQVRVEPGAVRAEVGLAQVEGVLGVVEVADLEVAVDGIELLVLQEEVLDLRSAHALQPDRVPPEVTVSPTTPSSGPVSGPSTVAVSSSRTMLRHVGALDGVDALGPERQPLQHVGGLLGGQVEEERVQPRPGEDPQPVHLGRLLHADPERDLRPAGHGARAGLRHAGAVGRGRNGEA